jgi:hypothetical protein
MSMKSILIKAAEEAGAFVGIFKKKKKFVLEAKFKGGAVVTTNGSGGCYHFIITGFYEVYDIARNALIKWPLLWGALHAA